MDVREKQLNEKRLQKMSEYIKKDELLKFKADVYDESGHVLYAVPTGCIVAMPPSDVVSVLHGRWEEMHYEGGICDDNSYGRPCVRALNEMCREKGIVIDYDSRNYEDIWSGNFGGE